MKLFRLRSTPAPLIPSLIDEFCEINTETTEIRTHGAPPGNDSEIDCDASGKGDVGVGEAVEAVFAEFVLLGLRGVDHVGACWGGDGGVESGVEEGDVGGPWD